jgi:hypothetical protein
MPVLLRHSSHVYSCVPARNEGESERERAWSRSGASQLQETKQPRAEQPGTQQPGAKHPVPPHRNQELPSPTPPACSTPIGTSNERFLAAAAGQHGKTAAPPANARSSHRVAGRTQPSIHAARSDSVPPAFRPRSSSAHPDSHRRKPCNAGPRRGRTLTPSAQTPRTPQRSRRTVLTSLSELVVPDD